jgi:tRNA(fMet)-specific endonuclease VapC
MDYLLDTSIVRPLFENNPKAIRRFSGSHAGDRFYTSVITEGELLFGASRVSGRRHTALMGQITMFIADLAGVLAVTRTVAAVYVDIRANLARAGRPKPMNDLWIASVAVAGDLTLVAHDKDFRDIDRLKVEDWLA